MKKITSEVAEKIIGGSDCTLSTRWNGNRCELVSRCTDKHGTTTSVTEAGTTYYCDPSKK
ncbi:DUF4762 family protein [Rahnella sp. L72c]|uniref:DUF4762 family protein n=1 Tax=Rahnella perminowiae TaxID=2816244 RepID=A0ABS6L1Y6_9GAMM|nr:DUF4762 family protein [Rahnella perminowiae]MBU9835853.1 DUF4762 family protein [Rahnella perminowiae]